MATFPSIDPDYNAQKNSAPRLRRVQFGDGYELRLNYGLNQNPKEWTLIFQNISETDSDTTIPYANLATINATFRQVFEP